MIAVMIVIMIVIAPALAPYLFEFLMTTVNLSTAFAVALPGDAQLFFGFMDTPFATLIAIGTGGRR
jgi:hypothetical protein